MVKEALAMSLFSRLAEDFSRHRAGRLGRSRSTAVRRGLRPGLTQLEGRTSAQPKPDTSGRSPIGGRGEAVGGRGRCVVASTWRAHRSDISTTAMTGMVATAVGRTAAGSMWSPATIGLDTQAENKPTTASTNDDDLFVTPRIR